MLVMKNLNELFEQAMAVVEGCGIQTGDIVSVTVNTRAKKRWGQCQKKGNKYYINISSRILEDDTDPQAVVEVIIHEILHTCKNCMTHKGDWKILATIVTMATGFQITRTTSAEHLGIKLDENRTSNYVMVCQDCGQVYRRERMSNFIRHPERYRCGICGGNHFKQDIEHSNYVIWRAR